ncbi:MAG: hypothetical protein OWV35_02985 [Firmicutes bacterium]|nr:hypothetical protein [Bacillota bacterium]
MAEETGVPAPLSGLLVTVQAGPGLEGAGEELVARLKAWGAQVGTMVPAGGVLVRYHPPDPVAGVRTAYPWGEAGTLARIVAHQLGRPLGFLWRQPAGGLAVHVYGPGPGTALGMARALFLWLALRDPHRLEGVLPLAALDPPPPAPPVPPPPAVPPEGPAPSPGVWDGGLPPGPAVRFRQAFRPPLGSPPYRAAPPPGPGLIPAAAAYKGEQQSDG